MDDYITVTEREDNRSVTDHIREITDYRTVTEREDNRSVTDHIREG